MACAGGGHSDAHLRVVPVSGGADELYGKHLAERCPVPVTGREAIGAADHAEPSAAPADPFFDPGQVLVAQHVTSDVAQNDRVVGEELRSIIGELARLI